MRDILIPAAERSCMASGTPSCSLSSMAVAPSSCSSRSISSAAWSTNISRSTIARLAALNFSYLRAGRQRVSGRKGEGYGYDKV